MSERFSKKKLDGASYLGSGLMALRDLNHHSNKIVARNIHSDMLGRSKDSEGDKALDRSWKRSAAGNFMGFAIGHAMGGSTGALAGQFVGRSLANIKNRKDDEVADKHLVDLKKMYRSAHHKSGGTHIVQDNGQWKIQLKKPMQKSASIYKVSKKMAPNYGPSPSCGNCDHFDPATSRCALYDFVAEENHICDSWDNERSMDYGMDSDEE
jgi:hypothetical protein